MIEWRSLSTLIGVQIAQDSLLLTEKHRTIFVAVNFPFPSSAYFPYLHGPVNTRSLADRADANQSG